MNADYYIRKVENLLTNVGKGLLFILMSMIFMNSVMRYVFNSPITGVIQFVEDYVLIGMVFLLLSSVENNRKHIKVDILVDRIPSLARKIIFIGSSILTIGIFILAIRAFLEVAQRQWQRNAIASTWGYPIAPSRMIIAFGLVLLCIRLAYNIRREYSDG